MKTWVWIGASLLTLGLLSADTASAAPFDDLTIGDHVKVTILNGPKAVRITEVPDGDPVADFITYCVDSGAPLGSNITLIVTGFSSFLTPQTAYLYTAYRQGSLPPGYDINASPSPLRPDGLQEAIWCLEGDPACNGAGAVLAAQANCAVNGGPGCPPGTPFWTGLGSVFILHVRFDNDPTYHNDAAQDLLVWEDQSNCGTNPQPFCRDIPVPEPGSLVLLGSGLLAAAAAVRRRGKAKRERSGVN